MRNTLINVTEFSDIYGEFAIIKSQAILKTIELKKHLLTAFAVQGYRPTDARST